MYGVETKLLMKVHVMNLLVFGSSASGNCVNEDDENTIWTISKHHWALLVFEITLILGI